jgi:hypothetical protein
MDVSPVLVADLQAPEAVEPGERSFDHPAVASQAALRLDTTAGDAGDDAALAQGQTEVTVVVTLVGMELVRSATGPASNRARSRRSPGPRAGCRGRRPQDGASCPVCRDPFGSCPFLGPPRGRHRGGVQRGPVPVDAIGLGQLFEKHLVQPAPDSHGRTTSVWSRTNASSSRKRSSATSARAGRRGIARFRKWMVSACGSNRLSILSRGSGVRAETCSCDTISPACSVGTNS